MSKTLQFRRYNTTTLAGITPAEGELVIDMDQDVVCVGDGVTSAGIKLASQAQLNANVSTLNGNISSNVSTLNGNISSNVSVLNANIAGINSVISTANTKQNIWTATQSFTGNTTAEAINFTNVIENALINTTAISTTTTMHFANGSVQYWTTNAGSNTTLNLTWSGSTSLNTIMNVGDSLSSALLFTNGSTAYYPNAYQIDGVSVTPKWQANSTPAGGNANGIDVYGFTIIKTADTPTYTVLASQTQYK